MGFFDFFKKEKVSVTVTVNESVQPQLPDFEDKRKAKCPYCHHALNKIPGSKTKCPACGKFMYVRTSPKNIRAVVTEEEMDKIEEEWSIFNGTHGEYLYNKKQEAKARENLKQKFGGKEPSDNDVKWSLLNKETIETASKGDWGLYVNTRLEMGKVCKREERWKQALTFFYEVCYLDLNGPNNASGYSKDFGIKAFDPSDENVFLPPAVVKWISDIAFKKIGMTEDELRSDFFTFSSKLQKNFNLPVSVNDAWEKIYSEIKLIKG